MDSPEEWSVYVNYQFGTVDCNWFSDEEDIDDYWYGLDDGQTRCSMYGWYQGNPDDLSANNVCCACGGGLQRDPRAPSEAPSISTRPTNSPAPTNMEGELVTSFEGGNRFHGNMFDINALRYVAIAEFDIHTSLSSSYLIEVQVYTKAGSLVGAEYDASKWSNIGEVTVASRGFGNPTPLPSYTFSPVLVERNATQAFCIMMSTYRYMESTYSYYTHELDVMDDALHVMEGYTMYSSYIGGYLYSSYMFNGAIRYLKLIETDEPTASPSISEMPSISSVPSVEPTVSAMPSVSMEPTMACRDVEDWYVYSYYVGYVDCGWFEAGVGNTTNGTFYDDEEEESYEEKQNYDDIYGSYDDYYSGEDRCANYSDEMGYPFDLTAKQACCVCGGGDHFMPSSSPTISAVPSISPAPTSLCVDGTDWMDDVYGFGCGYFSGADYGSDWDDDYVWQRCIIYSDSKDENGVLARDACCACGGGVQRDLDAPSDAPSTSHKPSASLVPTVAPSRSQEPSMSSAPSTECLNVVNWAYSPGYDCGWFQEEWYDDFNYSKCSLYGDYYEDAALELTANQACCVCGGGQHTLPTDPPTVSAQPTSSPAPTSLCVDDPVDWKDVDNNFGCPFFENELDDWRYDDADSRCDLYWHWRDENTVQVRDACCVCGGGKLRDPRAPSDSPSISQRPTISPAPTKNEFELMTTMEGGNYDYGNMFDLKALRYLAIREFDVHTQIGYSMDAMIYTKSGSYVGDEYNAAAWTMIGTMEDVSGQGEGNRTPLPAAAFDAIEILPNETAAFCIILWDGILDTTGSYSTGQLFTSNDHLQFFEGVGLGDRYIGGYIYYSPRVWNGAIRYSTLKVTENPTSSPSLSMMPTSSNIPTMEPTISAKPSVSAEPTMICQDVVGWYDFAYDGCDWYEGSAAYDDDEIIYVDDGHQYYDDDEVIYVDDGIWDDAYEENDDDFRKRKLDEQQNTRAPTQSPNWSISPNSAQTPPPFAQKPVQSPSIGQTQSPGTNVPGISAQPVSDYDDDALDRCAFYGNITGGAFNLTANQACCICGGGQHTLPTASPTVSAAPTVSSAPTSLCVDDPVDWTEVSSGYGYTCDFFKKPGYCNDWGWLEDIFGVPAYEACCACNGGITRDPRAPSDSPSISQRPTISPAPTKNEFELMTTMEGGNYDYGNMFDLKALRYLAIREFDVHTQIGYSMDAMIYTKSGSYVGDEYNAAAWTMIGTMEDVSGQGEGNRTPLPAAAFDAIEILPNETAAFCIILWDGILDTTGSYSTGQLFTSNDHLQFFEGVGLGDRYIGGYIYYSPRVWNGAIRYSTLKVTENPTSSPSLSMMPTSSNIPTMEPTISAKPSVSAEPTDPCADVVGWYDKHNDSCDWYTNDATDDANNYCATWGDHHGGLYNMTANQACCVCGGGQHMMPSASPTVTVAPTNTARPTSECMNHDSWGIEEIDVHCAWFEDEESPVDGFYMDDGETKCDIFGFMGDEQDVTARQACCACGGGTERRIITAPPTAAASDKPSVKPSTMPIVEPTSTPSSTPSKTPTVANVADEPTSGVDNTWSSWKVSALIVFVQSFLRMVL